MKVLHIESGLGNQMLGYCEYLAMKQMNPHDECFIENLIFEIPECNEVICQWNGYELERVFNIKAPNIKNNFNEDQWQEILALIRKTKFWEDNWNYPMAIVNALNHFGYELKNLRGDFSKLGITKNIRGREKGKFEKWALYHTKRLIKQKVMPCYFANKNASYKKLFFKSEENIFTGQQLSFRFKGSGIEKLNIDLKTVFSFPELKSKRNIEFMNFIKSTNSIAIHARRGDFLEINGDCYRYGYFKRSINYIKKKVSNPVFIFFCDPGSAQWCKENLEKFGLNQSVESINFVDWNLGHDSYIDMQLMAECKHNVITTSSFGWWGAYLNRNPDKITCSPDIAINTTNAF